MTQHAGQVVQMSIKEAYDWCRPSQSSLTKQKNEIGKAILKEIRERLGFLNNVGLEYLYARRQFGTLSVVKASGSAWLARSGRG